MLNQHNEKGTTLIEVVIALAILGAVLVAVFSLYHVVLTATNQMQATTRQTSEINTIADELKGRFDAEKVSNQEDAQRIAAQVMATNETYEAEVFNEMNGLYSIQIKDITLHGAGDEYTIKIYANPYGT